MKNTTNCAKLNSPRQRFVLFLNVAFRNLFSLRISLPLFLLGFWRKLLSISPNPSNTPQITPLPKPNKTHPLILILLTQTIMCNQLPDSYISGRINYYQSGNEKKPTATLARRGSRGLSIHVCMHCERNRTLASTAANFCRHTPSGLIIESTNN